MIQQKCTEEILNSISHGIAAIASIIGFIVLIIFTNVNQEWVLFSTIIYGISVIILYTSSSLYHGLRNKKKKTGISYTRSL